jgi:hypothetical protein
MTPSERADRAKQLLNDPVLKGAFSDLRDKLVMQLEASVVSDVETQHEIALMLQLLKRIQSQLLSYQQEAAIDKHRDKQDSFIRRMRQSLT